jgi:hypothetical protein
MNSTHNHRNLQRIIVYSLNRIASLTYGKIPSQWRRYLIKNDDTQKQECICIHFLLISTILAYQLLYSGRNNSTQEGMCFRLYVQKSEGIFLS